MIINSMHNTNFIQQEPETELIPVQVYEDEAELNNP